MNPPVSNAVQGAYVVACVGTGAILGGGAIVFKEITECLGCALGGFCLSMWLLTLKEGGLIGSTGGKAGFIAAFTLVAFSLYFSRFTRHYSLIGCIAFAGATATVLGIDSLSRAGLKEFWAYVWDLNDNLFPLGADTYPLTKGIRVELAATVIIFLAGVVSQMRLWKIIQEHRAKKDAAHAEDERQLQQEEENVGRQIEAANARERNRWEAVYGEGEQGQRSLSASNDSGVGDLDNEKRMRHSISTTVTRRTSGVDEPIEMSEMTHDDMPPEVPPKFKTPAESVISRDEKAGTVTVRVAPDDVPEVVINEPAESEKKVWMVGSDGEARLVNRSSTGSLGSKRASAQPEVVPLPFTIPEERDDDDRSSIATFADDDDVRSKRSSFANRLSVGSVDLLRRLSQRKSQGSLKPEESPTVTQTPEESQEDLVLPRAKNEDDNDSLAATIDGMSSTGDDDITVRDEKQPRKIEIKAELADKAGDEVSDVTSPNSPALLQLPSNAKGVGKRPVSASESLASEIAKSASPRSSLSATTEVQKTEGISTEKGKSVSGAEVEQVESKNAKSTASVDSAPTSLTKDRLPRSLSRVAMSYRTNEWAKHLSNAEAPEPESLQLSEESRETSKSEDQEKPAPVMVEELQQTADTGAPPPAMPRSATTLSNHVASPTMIRSDSRAAAHQAAAAALNGQGRITGSASSPTTSGPANPFGGHTFAHRSMSTNLHRRTSGVIAEPIAEEGDVEVSGSPPEAIQEEGNSSGANSKNSSPTPYDAADMPGFRPPVPGIVSYSSPQTLLGKREMLLRNKSYGSLVRADSSMSTLPMIPSAPASDAGSMHNYPMYAAALGAASGQSLVVDADDLPLSQRRELMRQNSILSSSSLVSRPSSAVPNLRSASGVSLSANVDSTPFDSHQPQRVSKLPTQAARTAQLASFRESVAADLRTATPTAQNGLAATGRETPLVTGTGLLGASTPSLAVPYGGESDVRQSIDAQRSYLLNQKQAEAQRREMARWEKERTDQAFDERMRRGDLLEAHRDALRRMQMAAKDTR
ncbi:hypothetical protein UCRPA7_802 [Phaeoacremonium minimum UCRPA7]|uniref:TM7S3/TM198-like domain-containing protein n=1 Tax=Phaeoacremonium minimum (strain UCR-PA7) TaxID=1286976 RepID=R8BWE6_PHAM7|nr:hypothetical protein UCRPA7_802 [Phaeoacremonium minimum UCRPA7]EOO03668.1 hypothetical protein UCRPA7_802 [Phaeoacremonium minimum UCRPA7]